MHSIVALSLRAMGSCGEALPRKALEHMRLMTRTANRHRWLGRGY